MFMKERIINSSLYFMLSLYSAASGYVFVFTARPNCITFEDYIISLLDDEQATHVFAWLGLSFVLNTAAFIALLKTPVAHEKFKYVLAYLWSLVVLGFIYWGDLSIIYALSAGVVSYTYYKQVHRSNI
jgi:hypothetical protein